MPTPLVLKFGGATLGREDRVRKTVGMVRETTAPRVVVVSAREGVTDRLKKALLLAEGGKQDPTLNAVLAELHPGIPEVLQKNLSALTGDLRRAAANRKVSPSQGDAVLARGERLSAHWYAARLTEVGLPAEALEADLMGLETDGNFGGAIIRPLPSRGPVRNAIRSVLRKGRVPVITGYIGRGTRGKVATLGRGGSDYTATSVGCLIGARRTVLVKTDVSLFTADPKLIRRAEPVRRLSYEEAEELAQFGAKVLHPLTVEPARQCGMEVAVESLDFPGLSTTIGPAIANVGIRAMTLLSPVALLLLRVPGGRQRKGVIADVSRILSEARINVVTLYTSSALLCILVESAQGPRARAALLPFVEGDGLGASLNGPLPVALVTAIGEGIAADLSRLPRSISSKVYGVSGTTRTLSLAVPVSRGKHTLREVHRLLVEERSGPA